MRVSHLLVLLFVLGASLGLIRGTCDAAAVAVLSGGSSCTAPRAPSDEPFCFIPPTISSQAQDALSKRRISPNGSLREKPAATVTKIQAEFDALTAPASKRAIQQYLKDVTAETIAGVPVSTATPKDFSSSNNGRVLLFLHGGAYIKGSCASLWQVTAMTAQQSGLRVMCIDYRLAPQHPFPAALEDTMAVYKALIEQKGYKPSSIGLIGDSAGGGLALAVVQKALGLGLGLPGALGLMAPWSDLRKNGDSFTVLTGVDPVLQYELNLAGSALDYVGGDSSKLTNPLVSPLLADYGNGRPFPPTLIQVGLRDSLLSSAVLLYRKMVAGGLKEVTLSPWEGMWHVFQASLDVPEAQEAAKELAAFFKQYLR